MPPHKSADPEWLKAEFNSVMENPSEALIGWLASEDLTLENASKPEEWNGLLRALEGDSGKKTTTMKACIKWSTECAEKMRARGIHENRKVCRMVALFFSRAYIHRSQIARRNRVKKLDKGYTNEEWVLSHPGLVLSQDDPLVAQDCVKYELLNVCPSPEARNLLEHCARDPQYRNDLYKATRARKARQEDVVKEKGPEVQAIENLEAELLALVGEDDDVWP